MTRETKVGLAMVLLLVGVFGFLAYKQFTRPKDSVAATDQKPSEDSDSPAAENLDLEPEDAFPAKDRQREPEILPVAGVTRQIPQDDPDDVEDPFGDAPARVTSSTTASNRPKLPTIIPDDEPETFLEESSSDKEVGGTAINSTELSIDDQDPFLDSPGSESSSTPKSVSSPPAMEFEAADTEPEEEVSFVSEPEPVQRIPAVQRRDLEVREFDAKASDTLTVKARATRPEPVFDIEDAEPEDQAPALAAEPKPLDRNTSAPQLMLEDSDEDRYGGYEPIELVDGQAESDSFPTTVRGGASQTDFFQTEPEPRRTAVTITGASHVVQPGENFWSISQKKYGTGRYFQALAAHNQRQIPDATKMKPGTTISLPSEEELERRYPNLIPHGGPKEPAAADSHANQPGEFLVGQDGRPLYRVGARDTLSEIAQKYLGRSSRWMQILEMNRDVLKDGNSLKVGAVLRLPSDAGEVQLSNQPRAFR